MPVKIIIYEDNANLRESLNSLLALTDDYEVAASFPDCTDIVNQVRSIKPGVLLMDIDMPGINGIEAVKKVREFDKEVQIIMLTVFDDNTHVFEAIYAGANGYLLKKYVSDKLLSAISEVLEGGAPMSPSIARMIIGNLQQPVQQVPENNYQLTTREKETLQLLSQGNSFKRIYDKLHVRSQIEAVSKAINEKLV
jgi:DNA-binding NarL/FixJ family response regulator